MSTWGVQPFEDVGVGPLDYISGNWAELYDSAWDRKVKIYGAYFTVVRRSGAAPEDFSSTARGFLRYLSIRVGPLISATDSPNRPVRIYDEIRQTINFKVFHLQGRQYADR